MNPSNELVQLQREASALTISATKIAESVKDSASEEQAVLFLGKIKDSLKTAKTHFDFLTKPLKDHVKAIKVEYDAVSKPLEEAEALIKSGIIKYRNSEEFKKKEAERIALEEYARAAVRDNDIEKLSVIASEHNDVSQAAPKTVKTSEANMHMRKNIRFEIVDMDLIPKAYLLVNDSAVKAAIKDGYDVPGIKHWIEMTPTIVG